PAANVQDLAGSNLRFHDIDIQAGSLGSSQLALNPIGVDTTKLRYVFQGDFTVGAGATLTVAAGLPLLISAGGTLTHNGRAPLPANAVVTFGAANTFATEQIVVGTGGQLTASGTTFTAPTSSNTGLITVNTGGQFIANGDTFTLRVCLTIVMMPVSLDV